MILGYIFAAFTIFVWGVTFVCTKYLLGDFSALEILFIRYAIAFVGLWIIHPKWEKIAKKDNIFYALAGLTGVVIYQFSENLAVGFSTASNVSVIVSISPLFTAIIAQIFLKEKHLSPWFLLGFVISIIGVTLVTFNGKTDFSFNPKGDLLALASSISWGFYSLFVSIINKRKYDTLCSTRRIFFFALIFMLPLIFFGMKDSTINLNGSINAHRFTNLLNNLSLLFLGIIASGLCFCTWNKACDILGTINITKGLYLIPVVTIIFAVIFLGEKITPMGIAGSVITILGLFISGKKKKAG